MVKYIKLIDSKSYSINITIKIYNKRFYTINKEFYKLLEIIKSLGNQDLEFTRIVIKLNRKFS